MTISYQLILLKLKLTRHILVDIVGVNANEGKMNEDKN